MYCTSSSLDDTNLYGPSMIGVIHNMKKIVPPEDPLQLNSSFHESRLLSNYFFESKLGSLENIFLIIPSDNFLGPLSTQVLEKSNLSI